MLYLCYCYAMNCLEPTDAFDNTQGWTELGSCAFLLLRLLFAIETAHLLHNFTKRFSYG